MPVTALTAAIYALLPTITTLPARLDPLQVNAAFEVSRREATWTITA
jgi:hypothetical protein